MLAAEHALVSGEVQNRASLCVSFKLSAVLRIEDGRRNLSQCVLV